VVVKLSTGWGKGGSAASAWWQVTLCDVIWHAGSRSGAMLLAQTAIRFLYLSLLHTGVLVALLEMTMP